MSSEYEIFYADKQVEKQLRDLPRAAFKKIDRELMKLKENPRSAKVKKIRGKEDVYELKVWPYRVLFDIEDTAKRIVLYEVIHRKDLEKYLKRM